MSSSGMELRPVTSVSSATARTRVKSRSMPTALDIHGNRALVVTYKDAYLYQRKPGEPWADAFEQIPERIALPRIGQQEAAAFSDDGTRFFTTTERFEGTDSAGIYTVEF